MFAPIFFENFETISRSLTIKSTAKPKSYSSSIIDSHLFSICQDCAAPLEITSKTSFDEIPDFFEKLAASASA